MSEFEAAAEAFKRARVVASIDPSDENEAAVEEADARVTAAAVRAVEARIEPFQVRHARAILPPRPWAIHVYESDGDTDYQVQAADGQVISNFLDSDFDRAGAARAVAFFLATRANALDDCETFADGDPGPGLTTIQAMLAADRRDRGVP